MDNDSLIESTTENSVTAQSDVGSSNTSSGESKTSSSSDSDTSKDNDSDGEMSLIFLSEVLCPKYFYPSRPMYNSRLQGQTWLGELFSGHPDRFARSMRMNKNAFNALCDILISRDLIKVSPSTRVGCHESLAIFLTTVGFTTSQRISCERFQHSLETISRHIKKVTIALNKLAPEIISSPDFTNVHPKILGSSQLFPYFKDCIGAIDGTLISAWAPARRHNAYRSRKSEVSQNVMAICDFNLLFTYVMAGWEGSANDSRVLMDAVRRDPKFPWPPEGKYYLVDSGYSNFPGFLSPYRGTRYHQRAWSGRQASGPQELFNKRHSSLRSAIERTFGILKGRFPILKGPMPRYMQTRQVQIVIACCVVHNFIRKHFCDDTYFMQGENGEFDPSNEEDQEPQNPRTSAFDINIQNVFRDEMAATMWANR